MLTDKIKSKISQEHNYLVQCKPPVIIPMESQLCGEHLLSRNCMHNKHLIIVDSIYLLTTHALSDE